MLYENYNSNIFNRFFPDVKPLQLMQEKYSKYGGKNDYIESSLFRLTTKLPFVKFLQHALYVYDFTRSAFRGTKRRSTKTMRPFLQHDLEYNALRENSSKIRVIAS